MAVATPCLQFPHTPTKIPKPAINDVVLHYRSNFLGTTPSCSSKLQRTRSCDYISKQRFPSPPISTIRRACSASFANSNDEDFTKKIHELAFRFQHSDEEDNNSNNSEEDDEAVESLEPKVVDLNHPFKMMKFKKDELKENFIEVGETACCSMKKAFSSMVFIIRELHTYSLHMREILYYEDLQGILARVQGEMHASFVWLFQQVFSHTPTLMVYVMILLANFTVHSMSTSAAIAAPQQVMVAEVEVRDDVTDRSNYVDFDASVVKSFDVTSSSSVKSVTIGGNNGGGDRVKPVSSGMDGDGPVNKDTGLLHRPIVTDGVSTVSAREDTRRKDVNEAELWNSVVDEASRMQGEVRDESLDNETLMDFVAPVNAAIDEGDDHESYFRTDLFYQSNVVDQPANVLLLANYAQFLYLVARDYDRAEEYFKRAIEAEPKDAEAYNKYANFLWHVKKDYWAAEETFLEAISVEPSNTYYAASYANFLWNTGAEDTCYPIDNLVDDEVDLLDD